MPRPDQFTNQADTGHSWELTADEFFDVYRTFKPGATREEFNREWVAFQEDKALRQKKKSIQ